MNMYPIQGGPSVPWEVMIPHEAQSQKNHSQSIQRIAERGGFSCAEAWAIVNGLPCGYLGVGEKDKSTFVTWEEAKQRWIAYAERINLHYAELEKLRVQTAALRKALQGWRDYFQAEGMDPETEGERFTSAWFEMEEALKP